MCVGPLFFFFLGGPGALFECMHELDRYQTAPALMITIIILFGVEHEAVSRTVRPEPLVLPPTSSRSPLK